MPPSRPPIARPPPKPRGCLRTLLVRFLQVSALALGLAVVAMVVWLRSDDFQERALALAERLVEHQTGEQLSVSRVDIRYWPPRVEVVGANLFHEPTGDTIVSAERLTVPLQLTWRGPRVGVVRLQRPTVQLHVEEDGLLREFRGFRRNPNARPLRELPLDGLQIVDGTVRLHHAQGEISLQNVELVPRGSHAHDLDTSLFLHQQGLERTYPLDIDGIFIGPTAIEVPDLQLTTPPLDLEGRVVVPLQGDLDIDLSATARLDAFSAFLPPPRALFGEARADIAVRGPPKDPRVLVTALGTDLAFDAPGRRAPVLHYRFDDITLAARATKDRIEVEELVAYWADGTLRLTGLIDPKTRMLVDARAVGDNVGFAKILTQFDGAPHPWVDMSCDAEVHASGSLHPLHLEGTFDFAVADLLVADRPVTEPNLVKMLDIPSAWARGTLTLEKDHIRLVAPELAGPGTRGRVDVDIGFAGTLDLKADLDADLSDFQPLGGVQLAGRGPIRGRIRGPFKHLSFEGTGELEAFSVLGIPFADRLEAPVFRSADLKSIELAGATAHVGGSSYGGDFLLDFKPPMSMTTTLAMRDGRIRDILGVFLELEGLDGDMTGSLSLDGPLFDMDGRADFRFEDVDLFGEHFPAGEARGFLDAGRFTLDDLRLLRRDQAEGVVLRGSVGRAWSLNMDLLADGFQLQHLDLLQPYQLPLSGNGTLHARIDNTLFEPAPHGSLHVREVRYAGRPLDDSRVTFGTTDGVMDVEGRLLGEHVVGSGTVGLWNERPFALDIALNRFPADLVYPEGADGSPIQADITGLVALEGRWDGAHPVGVDGALSAVDIRWRGHHLTNRSPWLYRQSGNAFELDNFDLVGGRTDFAVKATGGEQLELDGRGRVELDLLRAVVPGLQRAEGVGRVRLDVTGAAPDVEAAVDIDVEADLLRYAAVPAAFEDVSARLRLTQDRFVLEEVTAGLGGGRMDASGTIEADAWIPTRYDLRAEAQDAQIQWVESLPPAIGDATLRFDGPADALLLQGDVVVEDMVFADRIDWEDWVVEYRSEVMVDPTSTVEDDGYFDMDVRIRADESVRLRNNVAEGTASADLRIIGDTSHPGLLGWARIDDAEVVLQDRTFRVDRGEVAYDDPWTWDPDVDFELVTDIESRNQRYRVDYQVFGPFSDWRTATRSDPPLPQSDVNALLWFGVTTDDLEQSGELPTAVAQGVADLLLTDLFASTQAGELGEVPDLLFDRIDVATGVNGRGEYSAEPRLVVSKRLADLGDVDLTWEFNLGRPEDNYIRVDRRVGGVWSIAGWYATLQRDRVLPIGGAYGIDITARWEMD